MQPLRVLTVFGTRPEAIKLAPVILHLNSYPDRVKLSVCVTGQHREMLDQVLNFFSIVPEYDFNIMKSNQTLNHIVSQVLVELDILIDKLSPDWILVQGDTSTVMAAAISAQNRRVQVGHIEAGLRTYDRDNPFPEEMNRVLTDHVSGLHFAPTSQAATNLIREGISQNSIFITGNTVIDALNWAIEKPLSLKSKRLLLDKGIDLNSFYRNDNRRPEDLQKKKLILVTAHRRENFGQPIINICQALKKVAENDQVHILYPVHLNPNISKPVYNYLSKTSNITLMPPLDYPTLVQIMKHCSLILTDSGGIQEEAPTLGIPVLVLRETTERPEAVDAGAVRIVGTDTNRIITETENLLNNPKIYHEMAQAVNPYGDGKASERIVDVLLKGYCQPFKINGGRKKLND